MPKEVVTLEVLEARHASQKGGAAANTRQLARELAARNRVLCPSWALLKVAGRKPKPTLKLVSVPARPEPLQLAPALIAWRGQSNAHAVVRHADGRVTLRRGSVLTGGAEEATFATAAEAAAAVVPPIPWRKLARPERRFVALRRSQGRSASPSA